MAVEQKRNELTAGGYSSAGPRNTSSNWANTFEVKLDKTDDPKDAEEHDAIDLIRDTYNLYVNETAYVDMYGFQYLPWAFANNLRSQRNAARRDFFEVMATYAVFPKLNVSQKDLNVRSIPEANNEADATPLYPYLREITYQEAERIIWEEAKSSAKLKMALPTGSLFSEPFRRRYPAKIMRQSQFEQFTQEEELFAAIEERLYSINLSEWDNDPVDPDNYESFPPRWMVTAVDYQKVRMPFLSGNPAITLNWTDYTYLMTYTMERNADIYGWLEARALVDYYHLTTPNDLTTKTEYRSPVDGTTITQAYLNADGTLRSDQDLSATGGRPTYGVWETQPMIPFQEVTDGSGGWLKPEIAP